MIPQAQPPSLEGNLRRYPFFSAVSFTPFMVPVLVLFWQDNGLDLFEIFLLQGIYAIAVVLCEVPTGMVADRVGKKTSLLAGCFLVFMGVVLYAVGHGFAVFLVAESILAVATTFFSGADSALLYDTLKALDRTGEFKAFEGRARAIQMIVFALCNLIGGFVGSHSYRATLWMTALGPAAAFCFALGFREVNRPGEGASWKGHLDGYRTLIGDAVKFVRKHRLVRWQILFLGVLSGSSTWLLWLYQPYMSFCGLPVWAFGIAFALFNLFAALSSHFAHDFDASFGRSGTLLMMILLQIVPLFLMSVLIHPLSFLLILGHQGVRGLSGPIMSERILRYTFADKRATVLSISSLSGRFFFASTAPLVGLIARHTTLPQDLALQGAILTMVFLGLFMEYRRIPQKYFTVKSSVTERQ